MQNIFSAEFFSAIAAVAALGTAAVNYHQSRIASRMNTAQIYLEFSRRYNSAEIPNAIQALIEWKRKYPTNFAETFSAMLVNRDAAAVEIDLHRRTLNRYFVDIADAYREGVLNKTFACLVADQRGASIWRHIVVPMNMAQYQRSESSSLKTLLTIIPHFGENPVF